MTNKSKEYKTGSSCQFYVIRKKRLCRMTVRPGKQYCGEHEPHPETENGTTDVRIPCPNDPKHTCYASKLEKHLSICNARPVETPDYIVHNINVPVTEDAPPRKLLSEVSQDKLKCVIDKINILYEKYVRHEISDVEEQPIHAAVLKEFSEAGRTESSRRHLRQVSSLLRIVEGEGLVKDDTCYVELGAGKGALSYYMWRAWCSAGAGAGARSSVVCVERSARRHKRDNALAARTARLRADLAHLALPRAPLARDAATLVGVAKHLCGVAEDYALRCLVGAGAQCAGAVLAACCHHRCRTDHYLGREVLHELGISDEELDVMLGIVSWATCGDGRPRDAKVAERTDEVGDTCRVEREEAEGEVGNRARVGRRAKALVEWGRAAALRREGWGARLLRFVPPSVSPENLCLVAVRQPHVGTPASQ